MSTDNITKDVCIRKKAPYYEYRKGWRIDDKKYDSEVGGYIHVSHQWYGSLTEAKNDYQNQYQIAKKKALSKGKKKSYSLDTTLADFMEAFSAYRLTKVKGSTYYHLDRFIQKTFLEEFYKLTIKEVFDKDFAIGYKQRVLAKDLTKAYKNKALGYYCQMCDYAFGSGMLPSEQYAYCKFATEHIGKEEEMPKPQRETFALSDEEVSKLLNAIDDDVHLMLTEFLFATGFRLSEARALTPAEIDFEKGEITRANVWQVNEFGTERRFHRTKSGMSGTFPASEQLLVSLAQYIERKGLREDDCLFPCSTDVKRPVEIQWYRKKLKRYCKKAGIREIHPHIARHTFCTKVAELTGESNADKRSLEMLTGHTLAVNQAVYTHADNDKMREIVNSLSKKA